MGKIKKIVASGINKIRKNYYRKRNVQIREDTIIRRNSYVTNSSFGYLSGCNRGCVINQTYVGNYVNIASNVSCGARNHIIQNFTTHDFIYSNREHLYERNIFSDQGGNHYCVKIGHDVWIGENSFVASGCEIGNGAVVAAHSVVTKSVPPYAVVGGNPAKFIKWRFDEDIIEKLEATKWYEKEPEEVLKERDYLEALVHFNIEIYKKSSLNPKTMMIIEGVKQK